MASLALGSAVLSVFVRIVFDKATTMAQQQFEATSELKRGMQRMQMSLSIIRSMLRDVEKREHNGNDSLRTWLVNLRKVVYDADDVLDEMEHNQLKQKVMENGISAGSLRYAILKRNPISFYAHSFTARINEIQDKLNDLLSIANYFKLEMVAEELKPVNDKNSQGRITFPHSFDDGENIIGRDMEKQHLISLLLDKVPLDISGVRTEATVISPIKVIAIVGMGGVGKTTLAQLIFHDEEINNHFELKMWACVSYDFNVERIIQDILKSIAFTDFRKSELKRNTSFDTNLYDYNGANEKGCQLDHPTVEKAILKDSDILSPKDPRNKLKDALQGKKFLLVLDDLWDEGTHKWNDLARQFKYGKEGSKVLITCRNKMIASRMCNFEPIVLGDLSEEVLASLLMKHALLEHSYIGDYQKQHLKQISKKITKKLKGSPLAARTIGRLLSSNLSIKHWNNILESDIWKLPQNEDDIMTALQISYQQLPDYLKPCLMFCSLFPKGYHYYKREIIQMWMALGLLQQGPKGMLAEDTGNTYVNDLLNMSIFQPCKDDKEVFMIHDLIHDVAKMVSTEEALLIHCKNNTEQIPNTARHLAVHTFGIQNWNFLEKIKNVSDLRSLIFLNEYGQHPFKRAPLPKELSIFFQKNLSKAKSLRILKLSHYEIEDFPNCFSKLKCLRFLDISHTRMRRLPSSVTNLYHLQVLSIEGCFPTYKLPSGINNLVNLRHLHCKNTMVGIKIADIKRMELLQEVDIKVSRNGGSEIRMLKDMKQIKILCIRQLENIKSKVDATQAGLRHMNYLTSRKLVWTWHCGSSFNVLEELVPNANIKRLTMRHYSGERPPSWLENLSF